MDKIEEVVASMLGLTPKYGNFAVFAIFILVITGLIVITTKDKTVKIIVVSVFSIILLASFGVFGYERTHHIQEIEKSGIPPTIQPMEYKEDSLTKVDATPIDKVPERVEVEENFYEEEKVEEDIQFSLEETILNFIDNINLRTNDGYNNSYDFIARSLNISKEEYLSFWNENHAQIILNDINESNNSFSVIIDFDKSSTTDLFNTYRVVEDTFQWYIVSKTQIKLNNFDDWKITGDEQLKYSNKKEIRGILYKKKPTIHSEVYRGNVQHYTTIAYVETEEGKFYLTQYSLRKLIEEKPTACSWIHEIK